MVLRKASRRILLLASGTPGIDERNIHYGINPLSDASSFAAVCSWLCLNTPLRCLSMRIFKPSGDEKTLKSIDSRR